MRLQNTVLAAMLLAGAMAPVAAQAQPAGGACPISGGFTAVRFGDIPDIPADFFAKTDANGDGTICAKILPINDHAVAWLEGVGIDNTVGQGHG